MRLEMDGHTARGQLMTELEVVNASQLPRLAEGEPTAGLEHHRQLESDLVLGHACRGQRPMGKFEEVGVHLRFSHVSRLAFERAAFHEPGTAPRTCPRAGPGSP